MHPVGTLTRLTVLLSTHEAFLEHDAGRGHPERPARLQAVLDGVALVGERIQVERVSPRAATRDELEALHPATYLDALERFCAAGGGRLDPDTSAGPESWEAAVRAAGAGPDAVERLDAGDAEAAFLAVRPPGHHATPTKAMGFCLLNNVAVTAAVLAGRGERVLVVDYDAHHGNGTQDAFWSDGRVLYASIHEYPLYPFTGRLHETGEGEGAGLTVNVPLPAGATGDVALAAFDEVLAPKVEAFAPTWVLLSAGFDGHRWDPLTGLGFSSGDYALLTERVMEWAAPGKRIAFLEGGYDLEALRDSTAACVAALAGVNVAPERPTNGGPGMQVVQAALNLDR